MARSQRRPRICFVVATPGTAETFLNPHIRVLSEHFDVSVIADVSREGHRITKSARVIEVPIQRRVHLRRDVRALLMLRGELKNGCFDIVHSVTPKAGLLTALASLGLSIPNRLHWYTGQVWATKSGWTRVALKILDRLIARRTTLQLVDSPSQRAFLMGERVISDHSSLVLGAGSICGVDTDRFRPDQSAREEVRQLLKVPMKNLVVIFVGRLNPDKGVLELAAAFELLEQHDYVHLLFVGADEAGMADRVRKLCSTSLDRVHIVGLVEDPECYFAAADVFCLPSYREGFGLSVIEAAACELPAVVTNIYGLTDAVEEEKTGLLVPTGDPLALSSALSTLLLDPDLRAHMGAAGRQRAIKQYRSSRLTGALLALYLSLVSSSQGPEIPTDTRSYRT